MGWGQRPHSSVGTSWVEGEPVATQPVPSILIDCFWGRLSKRLTQSAEAPFSSPPSFLSPAPPHSVQH